MSAMLQLAFLGLATGASMVAADAPAPAGDGQCVPLAEATDDAGLSRLSAAVRSLLEEDGADQLALLATTSFELPESNKVTIFAPEDAAWPAEADLPKGGPLLEILLGHVVNGYLTKNTIFDEFNTADTIPLDTYADTEITASYEGEDVYVSAPMQAAPGSKVVQTDVETCIGVIHIVDALIMAGGDEATAPAPAVLGDSPLGADPLDLFGPAEAPAFATPTVDPVIGAVVPAGSEDDAFAPVGDDADGTRELGDGSVTGEDPSTASNMMAGTVLSVLASVVALLA